MHVTFDTLCKKSDEQLHLKLNNNLNILQLTTNPQFNIK